MTSAVRPKKIQSAAYTVPLMSEMGCYRDDTYSRFDM